MTIENKRTRCDDRHLFFLNSGRKVGRVERSVFKKNDIKVFRIFFSETNSKLGIRCVLFNENCQCLMKFNA